MDSDTACPKGGEHKLVTDYESGEMSCSKCGITIIVDEGTGDDPVIGEHGLGSHIGKDNVSFGSLAPHHKFVPGMSFAKEIALARHQIGVSSGSVLPQRVKDRALALFKKTRKPLKGKNFKTFVGACLFIACREQGIGKYPEKAAAEHLGWGTDWKARVDWFNALSGWGDARLVRYYKEICNYLEINLPPDKAINNVEWIGKRVEYHMYGYENDEPYEETLKLPPDVIKKATKLLSKIPDSETGSNPLGIAASILYIVSVTTGHPFTQRQFAEAAEVNLQTVSRNTKRLNSIIKKNKLGKYVDHNTRYHRGV